MKNKRLELNLQIESEIISNWSKNINDIVVSICCITYNHEKYIEDALKGFLSQKTSFQYEILIHDDASTDSTATIIKQYEEKYPRIIKPIYQTVNQKSIYKSGMNPRFNYPRARGKYIALCDGDDYWTDPLKLQKQVNFLKNNYEYSLCGTVYCDTNDIISHNISGNIEISDEKLINSNPYGSLTMVFRNIVLKNELLKMKIPALGDYYLWLLLHQKGKGIILKDNTAIYRLHENSIFSNKDYLTKLRLIVETFNVFYKKNIMSNKSDLILNQIINLSLKIGRISNWSDKSSIEYSYKTLLKFKNKINYKKYTTLFYILIKYYWSILR